MIFNFVIKSLTSHDFGLLSLFIFETTFNDANIVIKKRETENYISNTHFAAKSSSVTKSIASYKFNLSTFAPIETLTFIYELYKKSYFTVADLYIRYALLSKFQVRSKITRIIIMLFIIFMQNLYKKKFHNKEKSVIFTNETSK